MPHRIFDFVTADTEWADLDSQEKEQFAGWLLTARAADLFLLVRHLRHGEGSGAKPHTMRLGPLDVTVTVSRSMSIPPPRAGEDEGEGE